MGTKQRTAERGTQIVELAIVLPLLAFLVMGLIDASSMLRVHQILNNATREGARVAVANSTFITASNRNAIVQATVTDYLTKNKVVPGGGASFTYGQCNSWVSGNVTLSSGTGDTFTIPAPNNSSDPAVTLQTTKVSATCPYKFFFVPKFSFFGKQPLTVTLSGSSTLMNMP
jgi:Flp pilus assembly protein TadG